jgi:hypothetical protein
VAGKGHENYQIWGAERRHFDDREEVAQARKEKLKLVVSITMANTILSSLGIFPLPSWEGVGGGG